MKILVRMLLTVGLLSGCVSEGDGGSGGGGGGGADTFGSAEDVASFYGAITESDLDDLHASAELIAEGAGNLEWGDDSGQPVGVFAPTLSTGTPISVEEILAALNNDNRFAEIRRARQLGSSARGDGRPDAPFNFGIFVGGSATAQVALAVNAGCDVIWDVAHLQMTASCFAGVGTGSGAVSAQASAFTGYGFNFTSGADNWYGRFIGTTLSVGLPYDFVSADLGGFATPRSQCVLNGLGNSEPINWDTGIFGVNVGASAGAAVSPAPIGFAIQSSLWQPSRVLTDAILQLLRAGRFPIFASIREQPTVLGEGCPSPQEVRTTTYVAQFANANDFVGGFCKFTAGACMWMPVYWPIWLAY